MEAADRTETLRAFGQNVRAVRKELGWSQEELADRAALHRTYVSSVERGERNVGLVNIVELARALSCPPHRLLDGVR